MEVPHDDLELELLARASVIAELDGAEIEAWASGLFAVLDDDHQMRSFVDRCAAVGGPIAARLCEAIAVLADGDVAEAAVAVSRPTEDDREGMVLGWDGAASAAWGVSAPFGQSVVLAFESASSSPHAVLAELGDDGVLADLRLVGAVESLIDELGESGPAGTELIELSVGEAARRIADAWVLAGDAPRAYEPGVAANQRFVRRRLEPILGRRLPVLAISEPVVDPKRGLDDAAFAEANRAALGALRSAVGPVATPASVSTHHQAWIDVIAGSIAGLTLREAEALSYLEWADWLGVAISLHRAGPGADVDGESLVDAVNRCPEVSTSIGRSERDYVANAFDVAIDRLREGGVVDGAHLTERGHATLLEAMAVVWT